MLSHYIFGCFVTQEESTKKKRAKRMYIIISFSLLLLTLWFSPLAKPNRKPRVRTHINVLHAGRYMGQKSREENRDWILRGKLKMFNTGSGSHEYFCMA